jgi:peroxiredoxin
LSSLRDSEKAIATFNVAPLLVSLDNAEKNKAFAESVAGSLVILSDPHKQAAAAYGVLAVGRRYAQRVTFYINGAGRIVRIDRDVDTSRHGPDVVLSLEELGFPRHAAAPPD